MTQDEHEIVLAPGRLEQHYWRDLWRYRELLFFLAWRDVLVRYKQTAIGIAWAVLRPLLTMLVLTVVFNRLAGLQAPGPVPYAILVLCGMLPWQFFASAMGDAGGSLVGNSNLISKVYFPRLIIPVSAVMTSFVDFLITLLLLAVLMGWFGLAPSWQILALPLFMALAFAAALGAGLWIAALTVEYRDFRYVVPFAVQFGTYISPVGFSSTIVPETWRWLYDLNPMVGVIDGFRWAILGNVVPLEMRPIGLSIVVTSLLLYSGIRHFRRTERSFADVI